MVLVNYSTRELTAKLVYYGPGLCGKTTNLQYVYDSLLPPDRRGKMVSLSTETDRTLFFDFLPLELGTIRGLKTRLQLYTVPGQVHYNATRKIVLKGADGIVFVADSQPSKREGNIESYRNMKANLAENGLDLRNIPHVLQFNKRDLPDPMSIEQMVEDLNEFNAPFFEATAVEGIGVEDTLKGISRLVLKNLAGRFQPGAEPAAASMPAAAIPSPADTVVAIAPEPPVATPAPAAPPAPMPAPAMPMAALPPTSFGGASADLEDMLLGAPPAADGPLPAAAGDVFGRDPGPAEPQQPAMPEPLLEQEPEELELPTPEEEAMLRGDTVMSSDMFAAPGSGEASMTSLDGGMEEALLAGDTIMSPASGLIPPPTAKDFEFDAALLAGDTVMSASPSELPQPLSMAAPEPLERESAPMALGAGDEIDAGYDLPLSEDDAISLSSSEMLASPEMDLEANLLASPAAAPPPAAAHEPPAPIEIREPIELGHAAPGMLVERVLRVPLEYTDAAGRHQTTLEVTLRFKLG